MADEKVGVNTGFKTQAGRDVYKSPDGEMMSEKSITFEVDGLFVNIPSIYDGVRYSEEEVYKKFIAGEIQPTSAHRTEEEAISAAKKRSNELEFSKGGTPMNRQMEMFNDGGLKDEGGMIDEESGNSVPIGGTREGVRDDIPANISEGEFIFPADVVRYHGLDKMMALRQEAKMGLKKMEAMGQMGNNDEATIPDDMPFEMADLMIIGDDGEDVQDFAVGGIAMQPSGVTRTLPTSASTDRSVNTSSTRPLTPVQPIPPQDRPLATFKDLMGDTYMEMREYRNAAGSVLMIPFINGVPSLPIPVGYALYNSDDTATPPDATPVPPVVEDIIADAHGQTGVDGTREEDSVREDRMNQDPPPPTEAEFDAMTAAEYTSYMNTTVGFGHTVAKGVMGLFGPIGFVGMGLMEAQDRKNIARLDKYITSGKFSKVEQQSLLDIRAKVVEQSGGLLGGIVDKFTSKFGVAPELTKQIINVAEQLTQVDIPVAVNTNGTVALSAEVNPSFSDAREASLSQTPSTSSFNPRREASLSQIPSTSSIDPRREASLSQIPSTSSIDPRREASFSQTPTSTINMERDLGAPAPLLDNSTTQRPDDGLRSTALNMERDLGAPAPTAIDGPFAGFPSVPNPVQAQMATAFTPTSMPSMDNTIAPMYTKDKAGSFAGDVAPYAVTPAQQTYASSAPTSGVTTGRQNAADPYDPRNIIPNERVGEVQNAIVSNEPTNIGMPQMDNTVISNTAPREQEPMIGNAGRGVDPQLDSIDRLGYTFKGFDLDDAKMQEREAERKAGQRRAEQEQNKITADTYSGLAVDMPSFDPRGEANPYKQSAYTLPRIEPSPLDNSTTQRPDDGLRSTALSMERDLDAPASTVTSPIPPLRPENLGSNVISNITDTAIGDITKNSLVKKPEPVKTYTAGQSTMSTAWNNLPDANLGRAMQDNKTAGKQGGTTVDNYVVGQVSDGTSTGVLSDKDGFAIRSSTGRNVFVDEKGAYHKPTLAETIRNGLNYRQREVGEYDRDAISIASTNRKTTVTPDRKNELSRSAKAKIGTDASGGDPNMAGATWTNQPGTNVLTRTFDRDNTRDDNEGTTFAPSISKEFNTTYADRQKDNFNAPAKSKAKAGQGSSYGNSEAGGGGSGDGGGKIVCTAMNNSYGFGSYRQAIWLSYSEKSLTKAHEVGYHILFQPLVDIAYKNNNKFVRTILENIARHRTADLRAEMQGKKRDTLGRVYRSILEPICYLVGKYKMFRNK